MTTVRISPAAPMLVSLGSRSIITSPEEILLLEKNGGGTSEICGYIDLANLEAGDTVALRLYARVRQNGSWRMYGQEVYTGVQGQPLIFITPKPETHGLRVTLQQTAGIPRIVDYEFFRRGGR